MSQTPTPDHEAHLSSLAGEADRAKNADEVRAISTRMADYIEEHSLTRKQTGRWPEVLFQVAQRFM